METGKCFIMFPTIEAKIVTLFSQIPLIFTINYKMKVI